MERKGAENLEEKFKTESGKWDLERITKECAKELRKIRIPIRNVMEVKVIKNSYVACRVDQCHFGNGWFDLCILKAYKNPTMDLQEIKTAVCHLLLHTVRGCMNHDEKWMEYAEKTDRTYGLHTAEYADSAMDASVPDKEKCCFLEHLAKLEGFMGECSEELKSIGINVGKVSRIAYSNDPSYYGRCCKTGINRFVVSVSDIYLKKGSNLSALKGVICHELLHTCQGDDFKRFTHVHGSKWREKARMVEKKLGYKLMSESHSDVVGKDTGKLLMRYVCPVCGGYYDAHGEKEARKRNLVHCIWCRHAMNAIREEDRGITDSIYILMGELRDKLRIAGIPIRIVSEVRFVPEGRMTGAYACGNGSFRINLSEAYRQKVIADDDGFKAYLCRELIRTCRGCGSCGGRWRRYLMRAEKVLGIPL